MAFFLCGGSAWAASANPTILVLGDSLSAAYGMPVNSGWVALLEERLKQQGCGYRVVNASISGETSSGGLARLPSLLDQHQPEVVVLELGGNDGLRGLPFQQLRANLARMVDDVKARGAQVLLVGMKMPPNFGPAYTERFHAIYQELSRQPGVALVPFLLEGVGGNRALMQGDGVHASAAAQPQLLDNVWEGLAPLLTACPDRPSARTAPNQGLPVAWITRGASPAWSTQ